jgi:hypothetical protein
VLNALAQQQRDKPNEVANRAKSSAPEYPPGNLKDHTGELSPETMRVMNHEFIPLMHECYDQAHERNPGLRKLPGFSIQLAGAEEHGTIIETVEPLPGMNEQVDDDLMECLRQSAFSIQLPMPLKSGIRRLQITMPPDESQPANDPADSPKAEAQGQPPK